MSAEQIAGVENLITQAVVESAKRDAGEAPATDDAGESRLTDLHALRDKKMTAQKNYEGASAARNSALALGIPAFVICLALLVAYEGRIYSYAQALAAAVPFAWRIAILWAIAALVVVPLHYFLFHRGYISAKDELWRIEQTFMARRLSTEAGRKQYFREELFRLSGKAARVFFGDEQRFALASTWSERAGNILDGTDKTASLSIVQSCLNSLNELVAREEREQKEENRWQYWAIAVMVVYVTLLVFSAVVTNRSPQLLSTAVVGVPLSVILWGAAGSLAAILYRFYTEQGRIRFAAEFRWLIARPIIGIIMGAVVYLALVSGMVMVAQGGGAGAAAGASAPAVRMEAFWIIAFLAGFSDKFYLGVIDLLVARTVRSEEVDSNTVITQRERIPEAAPDEQAAQQAGDKKMAAATAAAAEKKDAAAAEAG